MIAILIIIGLCIATIFRKDWKKTVYLLILMVPFFGFIQLKILHLTKFAPLVQDITVILPLYLLFIVEKIKQKNNNQFYLPRYLVNFLLFYVLYIAVFTINPFYETNFIVRLVGAKIWLLYLLFIFIGFEFIENEYELKRLCNFFAIVAIIPCVIGILQYLGSFYIGQRETMSIFYGGNLMHAKMSTQGFGVFHWGAGVRVFRLPSTFSFSAQFSVFTLCAFIPAITSVWLSKTLKEKYFYIMVVVLVILGSYTSGIRATTIYFLLFLIFLLLIHTRFYNVLIFSVLTFIVLSFINLESLPVLNVIVARVVESSAQNLGESIYLGYGDLFSNYFFGAGVGSATFEARHLLGGDVAELGLAPIHEGFYHKAIKELGVLGLIVIIAFLAITIYEIFFSIQILRDRKVVIFCSALLSFYLISILMVAKGSTIYTKYPSNFLLYFFLGIAIKLRFFTLDKDTG